MKKGDRVTILGVTQKFPGIVLEVKADRGQVKVEFKEVDGSMQTAWLPVRNVVKR